MCALLATPFVRRWLLASVGALGLLLASIVWPLSPEGLENGAVVSLRITDRHGALLREVRPDGQGLPVALAEIHPTVVQTLLATEDRFFYRHPGINPAALIRAAWDNLRSGEVVSGGSTLTMQAARALLGNPPRTLWSKLREAHLALRLEAHLAKNDILLLWLNRVSFGNRAHGIEAAARLYFGKTARDLTTAEAAYLIGLPQSPSRYNPFRHPERARARQHRVLKAMARADLVTQEERDHLAALPLALRDPQQAFHAPHFTNWLLEGLPAGEQLPSEIRTTLDLSLQETVEHLARGHLRLLEDEHVTNLAAIVLDNATGEILAYLGSTDFWEERAGGQNDGVRMLRQPGSTLKPFTYALALASRRYTPATLLADIDLQVREAGGAFSPENYDRRQHGPVPLRRALASSYNIPAVRLAREIGPAALLKTLRQAGFTSLKQSPDHYGVGLTLGNGEVQLLELTRAYAALARGGTFPTLTATLPHQEHRRPTTDNQQSVFDAHTTYLITHILSDPEARAPAFGRGGPLELPFPAGTKTGTSKDYRDNWAVGYTPRHTVAVWAGNFDGSPMRWVSGVSGAGPLLKSILLTLGSGGEFKRPAGLEEAIVCPHSGTLPSAFCPARKKEIFLSGTMPTDICRVHQQVNIDRRNGLLADASTPANEVEARLFTVYPAAFHPWMRENDLPLPPRFSQATLAQQRSAQGDSLVYTDQLRVLYPESGTAYQLDPVLRPDFQRLHLRGATDERYFDVHWRIDGERLEGDYRLAAWALRPGTHHIELHALDAEGRRLRSRPVTIQVGTVKAQGG